MTAVNNRYSLREEAWMVFVNRVFQSGLPQAALKTLSAAHFSKLLNSRFRLGTGLEQADLHPVLASIRSFQRWPVVWSEAARKLELDGRRQLAGSRSPNDSMKAAHTLLRAALFYNYGQIVLGRQDLELKLSYQQKTQELYHLAAPHFRTPAERVEIPFRGTTLPGYLRRPQGTAEGLVVFVNGAGTVKEEFHRLSNVFLQNGYATLAFDDPGAGEAWPRIKGLVRQEKVAAAVIDHLQRQPSFNLPKKIVFFGISLGGMKVLRMAAGEPRISAVVAISSPFDSRLYFEHLNPFIQEEIGFYLGYPQPARLRDLLSAASLEETAKKVTVPAFIGGGSGDTVLPYREALRTYDALPPENRQVNRLFIYDAGHICLDHFDDPVTDALVWLKKL